MMYFPPQHVCSFFLLLAIGFAPSSELFAQSTEPIKSTQIFENVDFVAVAQIAKMKEYLDDEQKDDLNFITDWIMENTKLDASQCVEVLSQFGADEYPGGLGDSFGIVFRRKANFEAADIDSFVSHFGLTKDMDQEDGAYFDRGRDPGYYFNGNSMLVAGQDRIGELIESERTEVSRDIPFLEEVIKNAEICVHVNLEKESFRDVLLKSFYDFGPGADDLVSLMEKVSTANIQLRLSETDQLEMRLSLKDSSTATGAKKETELFIGLVKEYLVAVKTDLSLAPPGLKGSVEPFLDTCSEMLENAEYSVEDDQIVVTAKHDDAKQLPGMFTQSMKAVVDMLSNF